MRLLPLFSKPRNDENSKIPRDCFASLAMTKILEFLRVNFRIPKINLEFLKIASSFVSLTPRNDGDLMRSSGQVGG